MLGKKGKTIKDNENRAVYSRAVKSDASNCYKKEPTFS